ncbi:ATP-dependent helicase [Bacillus infantis]|uniref:ATP-dependent helicase n=1 Tax=Bacillus infantis TaxID=324767 RepID=UPI00209DADF6|nr:ATP-dependent helicase [Bacillus infantis]MCP1161244.1 ATP-dependent helicase [Bacillus infantis]
MFIKEKQAFKYPFQSVKKAIPLAEIASADSTINLVDGTEEDSYFFRSLEQEGIFLNGNQLAAVRSKNGPHLIIAGAGSGKTRVLTCRTAYLLTFDHDLAPENILLVTFTRKAAEEMIDRIKRLPGISKSIGDRIVSGTFHSIFLRFLRSNGFKQNILSSEKYKEVMVKNILRNLSLGDSYEPETILSSISFYKSQMILPKEVEAKNPVEKEIKQIYYEYERQKEKQNFIDFDDILLETYFLLKYNQAIRENLQQRFKYICVDEYQDTNLVQHEIIKLLLNPETENLFAVGDEDQCVYQFRNSNPDFILNLKHEFKHLKQITLDVNYRSTTGIVGLGNSLIKHNTKRLGKVLKSTKDGEYTPFYMRPINSDHEAKMIVDNIVSSVEDGGSRHKDFAILYRMLSLSRAVWDELVIRDIPFIAHGTGQAFYENNLVKPILDHMRLSLDPNNIEAIANISPTMYLSREKVRQHLTINAITQDKQDLLLMLLRLPGIKPYHQGQILNRIQNIKDLNKLEPLKAIQLIRSGPIRYNHYLELDDRKTFTLHKEIVSETLDELEAAASRFQSIQEFIEFVDLIIQKQQEMDKLKKDPLADAVQLFTLHASKGLEFPTVFMIGMCEGIIPHKAAEKADEQKDRAGDKGKKQEDAIEEERRLAYVGATRAMNELYVSSPKKYRGKDVEISRFLIESFKP